MDFDSVKAKNRHYPLFEDEKQKEWDGPFIFIQAADTQLGLIDDWNNVPVEERNWLEEIRLTKLSVQCINKLCPKPKFFVVCGDLVHAEPDKVEYEPQVRDLKAALKELDPSVHLVCVCGNHDIGNQPTPEAIKSYHKNFGDDYFSFWCGGVFFIVVNSQFHKDGSMVPIESADHDKWLGEQLEEAKKSQCKHIVVFQHIPLFLKSSTEDDEYFNYSKEKRIAIIKRLKDAGVKYVFCGHYHRNAGGMDGDLEVIVTSAIGCQLGFDKSGMRIVRVFDSNIDHKYFDLDHFPEIVSLQGDYVPKL